MIEIIDLLKPKNGGSFKLIEDIDIAVNGYSSLADCVAHMATTAMIEAINAVLSGKQDKLTTAQLTACNSGITSELVAQISLNATAIAGKANASDVATADANLQSQINQIVISASAEAVVAPEVAAARVSEDGTEYSTLKERLDAENEDTANSISLTKDKADSVYALLGDSFQKIYENISYTVTADKFLEPDGSIVTGTYIITNYVDVHEYAFIEVKCSVGYSHAFYAFYDASYNFISGKAAAAGAAQAFFEDVAVPKGATYVVVSSTNQNNFWIKPIVEYNAIPDTVNRTSSIVSSNLSDTDEATALTIVQNKLINYNGEIVDIAQESYTVATIDVSSMTKLKITASANYGNLLYVIKDTNGNVLASEKSADGNEVTAITDKTIYVPNGAKYCSAANIVNGARPTIVITNVVEGIVANDITEGLSDDIVDLINDTLPEGTKETTDIVMSNLSDIDNPISLTIVTEKLINSSGVVTDASGLTTYTVATTDISGMRKLKITASANYGNSLYVVKDDSDNILAQELAAAGNTVTLIEDKEIIVPAGAKYCSAANIVNGARPTVEITEVTEGLVANDLTEDLFERLKYNLPYLGKKWVCVGDSLTEVNSKTTKHYFDYVADATGITTVNFGVSGTGYKRHEDDDIAFYQRVQTIPTDADIVTIFGSFNDLTLIASLGDPTDTGTSTLCGCINTTIDNIIARIPDVSLGIVSPTPWETARPTLNGNSNADLYTDALRKICMIRSIPFLDLFHCSNLRPWTQEGREACYSKDDGYGVHPDETGHKLIAPRFKSFVESLLI